MKDGGAVCQWFTPVILATWKLRSGGSRFQASPVQIICETLPQKLITKKGAGGVAQAVEKLPSKYEALSSNSSATKEKKKDQGAWFEFSVKNPDSHYYY
jgi:hypothetical protein